MKTLSIGLINLIKILGCNMNTKNLYLSLTVLSSFFSALADGSQETVRTTTAAKDTFSGFYAMGSVGHSRLSALRKGVLLDTVIGNSTQSNGSFVSDRPILSIGIGCTGFLNPSVLMGIEGLGFWDNHKKKSEMILTLGGGNLSASETLIKRFGGEIRAKIGYLLRDDLCVYGGVGVERSSFLYKYTITSGANTFPNKKPATLWGGFPFIGLRASLTEGVSLDFTYKCTFYQKISVNWAGATEQFKRSIKPSNSIIQLGITYKIN